MTTPRADQLRNQLRAAGDALREARALLDARRAEVHPLILQALRADVGVVEVATLSGYTRENVRVLARKNGIEAK